MTLDEIQNTDRSNTLSKRNVHFQGQSISKETQCDILNMKKFRRLNEILAEKDLVLAGLQDDGKTPSETLKQRDKQIQALQIENMQLKKSLDREKRLLESKVREVEELQAQCYDDAYSERQELLKSKSTTLELSQSL